MELDLGCREDAEVRECFSLPEILKLKAQCELVHYHGAAPDQSSAMSVRSRWTRFRSRSKTFL